MYDELACACELCESTYMVLSQSSPTTLDPPYTVCRYACTQSSQSKPGCVCGCVCVVFLCWINLESLLAIQSSSCLQQAWHNTQHCTTMNTSGDCQYGRAPSMGKSLLVVDAPPSMAHWPSWTTILHPSSTPISSMPKHNHAHDIDHQGL